MKAHPASHLPVSPSPDASEERALASDATAGRPLVQFLGLAAEQRFLERNGPEESLAEHNERLHDPRDLTAEPCCMLCCDCQTPGDLEDEELEGS